MEEERRLAFVAMTRAEKKLFLTLSEGYGNDGPMIPSRFVTDIDNDCLEYTSENAEKAISYSRKFRQRASLSHQKFHEGQIVKHKFFGRGTMVSVDTSLKAYEIKFDDLEAKKTITFSTALELTE